MLDARDKIPEPGLIQAHMKQNRCCGLKCACVRCARVKRFIKKGAHLSRDVHRHQLRFFFSDKNSFHPNYAGHYCGSGILEFRNPEFRLLLRPLFLVRWKRERENQHTE